MIKKNTKHVHKNDKHEKIMINMRCEAVDAVVGIFWS